MQGSRWLGVCFAGAFPLLRWMEQAGGTGDLTSMALVGLVFLALLVQTFSSSYEGSAAKVGGTVWGALYVGWLFSFVVPLRCLPAGRVMVTMLFLMVKGNDMFAYLIGTQFGRHKFFPRLSPKKTWEGALGGMAGSLLAALLILPWLRITLPDMTWVHAAGVGIVMGVLAPAGDLVESLIKRSAGVKDSGQALFGTGGILDGMDSLLFCVPVFFFTMHWRFGG